MVQWTVQVPDDLDHEWRKKMDEKYPMGYKIKNWLITKIEEEIKEK